MQPLWEWDLPTLPKKLTNHNLLNDSNLNHCWSSNFTETGILFLLSVSNTKTEAGMCYGYHGNAKSKIQFLNLCAIILFLHVESLAVLPADPAEPSGQEENMCKICMDSPIDCVLLECGHMVTCSKCGKRMNECPICRQYVVRAVHVFRSWNSGAKRQTAHYRLLLFHTLSNILSLFSLIMFHFAALFTSLHD